MRTEQFFVLLAMVILAPGYGPRTQVVLAVVCLGISVFISYTKGTL